MSDAVEISRLRFTPLEMTGGVVPVGMAESVVSLGMADGVVAGREIPQNQLETVLVLYPDSSASPRDFPLSDAVEISRLRFTALEMTGGVVSLEMTGGVVSLEMTESVVSLEMTGGVVSLEMTEIVVSVEMTDGVVAGREIPQNQLETGLVLYPDSFASPRDFPVSDAVEISRLRFTPLEMTGGVVADRNDWWRCGRSK